MADNYAQAMKEFNLIVKQATPKFFTKEEVLQFMKLAYVRGVKDG